MTSTTDETTARDAASTPEPDENPSGQGEGQPESPNAEAARYRTKLREVEAEREGLAERLTSYQRREVERLAAERLTRPSDVWLDGAEAAALLDENGDVDPEAVRAAVLAVLDGRPQLGHQVADHGGGKRELAGRGVSWGDVLRR